MTRFLDRKDLNELINQSSGFTKRTYGSLAIWISAIALVLWFAVSLNINKLLYQIYSGVDIISSQDVMLMIMFMTFVAGGVVLVLLIIMKKLRHMLTAVEFQSSLFSGAARLDTVFTIIANNKNTIVYADHNANAIFTKERTENINQLIEFDGIASEDKEKLKTAISNAKPAEFSLSYKDEKGKKKTCKVKVNPIDKPVGYSFIKGI